MNQPITTYRATGRTNGLVFLFKYDLNGDFKAFEICTGVLSEKQLQWMFAQSNFPITEGMMKTVWMREKEYRDKFLVEVSPADISFDTFWEMWDQKIKKDAAIKAWAKLSQENIIKCYLVFPAYQAYLNRTGQAKAHLVTWLNQKRWDDEYK